MLTARLSTGQPPASPITWWTPMKSMPRNVMVALISGGPFRDSSCLVQRHVRVPSAVYPHPLHNINRRRRGTVSCFSRHSAQTSGYFRRSRCVAREPNWVRLRSRESNPRRVMSREQIRRNMPRLKLPEIPAREMAPVPLPLPRPLPVVHQTSRDVENLSDLQRIGILGHGSGGNVYLVRHKRTSATYALKVIHANYDPKVRRQIIREMEILKKTDSPYVVKCHGIFDKGEEIHFVLEYMDGGSLVNALEQKRMSEAFLARVAKQVLEGLKYLHRQKIVHRDIKPSNLLINRRQEVKIADFGVSRILSQTLDPCNTYVGTCAYMSPERFDPDSYGGRYDGYAGDIWSLGLSLLECYTGHFPFLEPGQKADWPTLMCAICYGDPPSPPPTASADFQNFIRCCLHKDARERWTASHLLTHPFLSNSGNLSAAMDALHI